MKIRLSVCAIAAAGLLGMPSPSRSAQLTWFQIGNVNYTVPIPSGYCLGQDVNRSEKSTNEDANPQTHMLVVIIRCHPKNLEEKSDYSVISIPKPLESSFVSRDMILSRFGGSGPANVNFQALERDMSRTFGGDVQIDGRPRRVGHDDLCAFQIGAITVNIRRSDKDVKVAASVGSCLTAIGGRAMTISRYNASRPSPDFPRLLREAEDLARSIQSSGNPFQ